MAEDPSRPAGECRVKRVARSILETAEGPGFRVDPGSTTLLLNSLVTAWSSRRRIYLNAFQRSGDVLHHFGHRLHRLQFNVHSLDPWAIIAYPQVQDVLISLSGSLETAAVLVTLLHADREGLYRFVITAQPADETRRKFQGVLPVQIDGVDSHGHAPSDAIRAILPLGGLFELRSFLYLEAVCEVVSEVMEAGGAASGSGFEPPCPPSTDALVAMLGAVRASAPRVGDVMSGLVSQYRDSIPAMADGEVLAFLGLVEETVRKGRSVYVTGYGRSNEVAGLFAHRLANLGVPVALTPTRIERPSSPGDLLVALTGAGNTFEVLQRMNGARQAGLRTAVFTAVEDAPVAEYADTVVRIPSIVEPRYTTRFAELQVKASAPPRPSGSTFGLNAFLTLEAAVAVLMEHLGKTEGDLVHTDPWQGS